jgi:hypothetical protein
LAKQESSSKLTPALRRVNSRQKKKSAKVEPAKVAAADDRGDTNAVLETAAGKEEEIPATITMEAADKEETKDALTTNGVAATDEETNKVEPAKVAAADDRDTNVVLETAAEKEKIPPATITIDETATTEKETKDAPTDTTSQRTSAEVRRWHVAGAAVATVAPLMTLVERRNIATAMQQADRSKRQLRAMQSVAVVIAPSPTLKERREQIARAMELGFARRMAAKNKGKQATELLMMQGSPADQEEADDGTTCQHASVDPPLPLPQLSLRSEDKMRGSQKW